MPLLYRHLPARFLLHEPLDQDLEQRPGAAQGDAQIRRRAGQQFQEMPKGPTHQRGAMPSELNP